MPEQINAQQLAGMSPSEIDRAQRAGQLSDYMNAPTSHARPYTVPTDPATGRPVVQLSAAEVAALPAEGKVAALNAGQLVAHLAGDDDPVKPEPEAPARANFQFGDEHVALMSSEDLAQFRAEGKLVDYDAAHPEGSSGQPAGGAEL
ncbi:hypothetical protein [Streptomyces incanus]|uniref:Uncharacterized protein n=1 Tax=Streptomyces incanus TaxID=887453 RepID=A0ABW0XPE4_9ACTN